MKSLARPVNSLFLIYGSYMIIEIKRKIKRTFHNNGMVKSETIQEIQSYLHTLRELCEDSQENVIKTETKISERFFNESGNYLPDCQEKPDLLNSTDDG